MKEYAIKLSKETDSILEVLDKLDIGDDDNFEELFEWLDTINIEEVFNGQANNESGANIVDVSGIEENLNNLSQINTETDTTQNQIMNPNLIEEMTSQPRIQEYNQISSKNSSKKTQTFTKCSKCGKRGSKECKLCKICCISITKDECKVHSPKIRIVHNPSTYQIILLDCETTDLKDRGLTDFYAKNISNNTIIEFPNFIRPRRKIENRVAELTNITNEMVLGGTFEKDAIQTIFEKLPPQSIIIAHNASFDRDTLMKTYIYWKQKHRSMIDFSNHNFIFLDSQIIFKERLNGLENYKLGTIYKHLFKEDIKDQHRAPRCNTLLLNNNSLSIIGYKMSKIG